MLSARKGAGRRRTGTRRTAAQRVGPRRAGAALVLVAALAAPLAATAQSKESKTKGHNKLFLGCKEAAANRNFSTAARLCGAYLDRAGEGSEKYESSQFFLGQALQALGFYHAAVELYFQVATQRRSPELLPRVIRELEELHRERPIDEALILRDLIGEADFGSLPEELADFVYYWQGLTNLRAGLDEWANERFSRVSRKGYYFYLALYTASVRLLAPRERSSKQHAVDSFARLFGPLDLGAALESLRRRGESDSKLAYALKALINDDNEIQLRFQRLPDGWEVELALLGFARVVAESEVLLERSKETDEEELGRPFAYQVQIGGIPIYRRSPRFEDRSPLIQAVAARRKAVRSIQGKAQHSLARLLFEQERFAAAYSTLGKIPKGTELSSEILLERAWAKYKAGDPHRAMGLLYALDAPVYSNLFAPEKYVLRGLIYRKFCHFRAAKIAARRYRVYYANTLKRIREGYPLTKLRRVRNAALRRGETRRLYRFGRSLRQELRQLKDYDDDWKAHRLYATLRKVYQRKLQQVRAELARSLEASARQIADEMLTTEEQVHLLEYEVGQAIFERVGDDEGVAGTRKRAPRVPISSSRAYYRFGGEYWTDELPSYKFNIEDRCVE